MGDVYVELGVVFRWFWALLHYRVIHVYLFMGDVYVELGVVFRWFGLSYTKEYRVKGGVYRAQGGAYVEHRVVFRWFGLSYNRPTLPAAER